MDGQHLTNYAKEFTCLWAQRAISYPWDPRGKRGFAHTTHGSIAHQAGFFSLGPVRNEVLFVLPCASISFSSCQNKISLLKCNTLFSFAMFGLAASNLFIIRNNTFLVNALGNLLLQQHKAHFAHQAPMKRKLNILLTKKLQKLIVRSCAGSFWRTRCRKGLIDYGKVIVHNVCYPTNS